MGKPLVWLDVIFSMRIIWYHACTMLKIVHLLIHVLHFTKLCGNTSKAMVE